MDFGILIAPADIKKYDFLRLPTYDTWGVLMKKDHPLAKLNSIAPTHLLNVPLLCSRQTFLEKELSSWLGFDYSKLNIISSYNLIYNAAIMVDEGIGLALTLDKLVNTSGECSLCFRPLSPILKADLVVVWKKYQVFSKASQRFLEELQKEIGSK